MRIKCPCGKWHDATATAMTVIIDAFEAGDLTRTNGDTLCFLTAFDDQVRINEFHKRYRNNTIRMDRIHYNRETRR